MHSVFAHRRMKHGKGNDINRGNEDPARSQKGFQVSHSRKETEGVFQKGGRGTWPAHIRPTGTRAGQITMK